MIACQFLRDMIDAFPYRLHTVLTDNGVQFCHPPRYRCFPPIYISTTVSGRPVAVILRLGKAPNSALVLLRQISTWITGIKVPLSSAISHLSTIARLVKRAEKQQL